MNITNFLLITIGVIFIMQLILPSLDDKFDLNPYKFFSEPWRIVTSMFLHGGLSHLFFNAYALFLFGTILESRISKKEYLLIYFGAGILGSILYFLTTLTPFPPLCEGGIYCSALGASGAIYGVMGALAMILPGLRVFIMFFPIEIKYAAILWFALEFLGLFNSGSGIASAGHLGGLIFGLICGWYIKNKKPPVYEYYGFNHY